MVMIIVIMIMIIPIEVTLVGIVTDVSAVHLTKASAPDSYDDDDDDDVYVGDGDVYEITNRGSTTSEGH